LGSLEFWEAFRRLLDDFDDLGDYYQWMKDVKLQLPQPLPTTPKSLEELKSQVDALIAELKIRQVPQQ
jgi:hypothetical protein